MFSNLLGMSRCFCKFCFFDWKKRLSTSCIFCCQCSFLEGKLHYFFRLFTFFHVPYVGRDCRTQLFLVFMWVHSMVITVTCHSSDAHLQLFFQRCSASTEVIQKQMTLREEVELQPGRGKKRIYLQFLAKRSTYFWSSICLRRSLVWKKNEWSPRQVNDMLLFFLLSTKWDLVKRCGLYQGPEKNAQFRFAVYLDDKKTELSHSSHYMQGSTNAMRVVEDWAF